MISFLRDRCRINSVSPNFPVTSSLKELDPIDHSMRDQVTLD
uniref:Uncharacterized protein n=1 Tax=Arundo donax TaxID=35708 RepID=A0A0A9GVI0_ARUDO